MFIIKPRKAAEKESISMGSKIGSAKKNHMICTSAGVFRKTSTNTVAGQLNTFFFEYRYLGYEKERGSNAANEVNELHFRIGLEF